MYLVARNQGLEPVDYDIPYTNLVWTQRWYDFGEFQMQIPLDVYDQEWKFISSPEKKNLAMVQKVEYSSDNGGTILLSGFFAEKALDRVTFGNKFNTWIGDEYPLYSVMKTLMNTYYTQAVAWGFLKITPGGDTQFDNRKTTRDFQGNMGEEFYNCLQDFGLSQLVLLDGSECKWHILEGRDFSTQQTDNQQIILSSAYGDFSNYSVTIDESGYKNVAMCVRSNDRTPYKIYRANETVRSGWESQVMVTVNIGEDENFATVARRDGRSRLNELQVVKDIDASMNDPSIVGDLFDLGDIVTVRIDEMDLESHSRMIELTETYSVNGKSTQVGFGNKRVSNIRRAMK